MKITKLMISRISGPLLSLFLALAFSTSPARAQDEPKYINSFKNWHAFSYEEEGGKVCYMSSSPKKQEGDYTSRDEPYILVTHRLKEKSIGVVSITAGYAYKEESTAEVLIDKKSFKLFTSADKAWAYDDIGDKALVNAMKKGTNLVVKGTSGRDTPTTDTYSLSGFTAAYGEISKACKAK